MRSEISDPRRAGQVQRYHTWPHIKPQSVAEHTWQMLRIAVAIWPQVPRDLLIAIIFHDIEEVITGDMPFGPKPEGWDKIKADARQQMWREWQVPLQPALTEKEALRLKLVDLIEMLEWSHDEMQMGNQNATLVKTRIEDTLALHPLLIEAQDYLKGRNL